MRVAAEFPAVNIIRPYYPALERSRDMPARWTA
jgi:hypothetical protein